MKAVVFANADITDYSFCAEYIKDAVIICCDGGMRHAMKLGITPDYIVGDFDSVSSDVLEYYRSQNIELKQVPCRKDETDIPPQTDRQVSEKDDRHNLPVHRRSQNFLMRSFFFLLA